MSILVVLVIFLAVCFVFSLLMERVGVRNLFISRKFLRPAVFCGDTSEMVETIINDRPIFIPWLRVESRISPCLRFGKQENLSISGDMYHLSLFSVMPYQKIVRHHRVTFLRRGVYNVGSAALTAGDLTGMFHATREQQLDMSVMVYPRILSDSEMPVPLRQLSGNWSRERHLLKDPFLVRNIRAYVPGDPIRDIHWPASARMQQLQVKIHDDEARLNVLVLLNGQTREDQWDDLMDYEQDQIEHLISVAATLCRQALKQGLKAGFGANLCQTEGDERESTYVPMDQMPGMEEKILSAMARIRFHRTLRFPSFLRTVPMDEGMDVVVLSVYDSDEIREAVEEKKRSGCRITLYTVREGGRDT